MREETRKRLDRELMRSKLKWAAAAVAVAAIAAGAFYAENLDGTIVATKAIDGTVIYVGPLAGKYKTVVAEKNVQVDVKLDGTRVAHLLTPRDASPKVGDHVTIADHVHGSGRHTYAWK
jgi:hypothetical protein